MLLLRGTYEGRCCRRFLHHRLEKQGSNQGKERAHDDDDDNVASGGVFFLLLLSAWASKL